MALIAILNTRCYINFNDWKIYFDGHPVAEITRPKHYAILKYLTDNPSQWLLKGQIIDACWGVDGAFLSDSTFQSTMSTCLRLHEEIQRSVDSQRSKGYWYKGKRRDEIDIDASGNPTDGESYEPSTKQITFPQKELHASSISEKKVIEEKCDHLCEGFEIAEVESTHSEIKNRIDWLFRGLMRVAEETEMLYSDLKARAEETANDIGCYFSVAFNRLQPTDPLFDVKCAALSAIEYLILFRLADLLLNYSSMVLAGTRGMIQKEASLNRENAKQSRLYEKYGAEVLQAENDLDEKIDGLYKEQSMDKPPI